MHDLETRIRELTYKLVEMAPEPPPFPRGEPTPRRPWRPALVWGGAAAVVAAVIALPVLFLLPTSDAPPPGEVAAPTTEATTPPATTTTIAAAPPVTATAAPTTVATIAPQPANSGLTLSRGRGEPGDELTICGTYAGDGEVTLDVRHPEFGLWWPEPIDAVIDVADDGSWCWAGQVPDHVVGLVPGRHDIEIAAVLPGIYEVTAGSYPEEYRASEQFEIYGVVDLGVTLDQGWSYVSTESTITLTGSAHGQQALQAVNRAALAADPVIDVDDDRFTLIVPLEPGDNTIEVLAISPIETQRPAIASITVQYLPDAERRLAFIGEVRPGDFEITVDFAEWLTGEEADAAAEEDGYIAPGEGVPNGYYIRNLDTERTTVPIAENPPIILQTPDSGPRAKQVTYEHWFYTVLNDGVPYDAEPAEPPIIEEPDFGFFGAGSPGTPYWLTIHNGTVVQVEQQYRP